MWFESRHTKTFFAPLAIPLTSFTIAASIDERGAGARAADAESQSPPAAFMAMFTAAVLGRLGCLILTEGALRSRHPAMDEAKLREKLSRIEALFAGATTEGERMAAAEARRRIQARLETAEQQAPPVEYRFTLGN